MNIKTPLVAALAGAGIAVAGSSAAVSLNPFKKHDSEQQLAQATAPADTSKGTPATAMPAPASAATRGLVMLWFMECPLLRSAARCRVRQR